MKTLAAPLVFPDPVLPPPIAPPRGPQELSRKTRGRRKPSAVQTVADQRRVDDQVAERQPRETNQRAAQEQADIEEKLSRVAEFEAMQAECDQLRAEKANF